MFLVDSCLASVSLKLETACYHMGMKMCTVDEPETSVVVQLSGNILHTQNSTFVKHIIPLYNITIDSRMNEFSTILFFFGNWNYLSPTYLVFNSYCKVERSHGNGLKSYSSFRLKYSSPIINASLDAPPVFAEELPKFKGFVYEIYPRDCVQLTRPRRPRLLRFLNKRRRTTGCDIIKRASHIRFPLKPFG